MTITNTQNAHLDAICDAIKNQLNGESPSPEQILDMIIFEVSPAEFAEEFVQLAMRSVDPTIPLPFPKEV